MLIRQCARSIGTATFLMHVCCILGVKTTKTTKHEWVSCPVTLRRFSPLRQLLQLLHPVESRAGLEPLDLRLVEGVAQGDGLLASVAVLDHGRQRLGDGRQGHASAGSVG